MSALEDRLAFQLDIAGIAYRREHRAIPGRLFRCDFAWVERRICLEVQGGTFVDGGHNRGEHYLRDVEKLNELNLAGWTVLLVTPDMVRSGAALRLAKRALQGEAG